MIARRSLVAVLALSLGAALASTAALGQQVTVSISPPSGNTYSPGPLSVSIQWCAVGATLDPAQKWITLNGQNVTGSFGWSASSQGGCDDYAVSNGTVTLGAGAHTLDASVPGYYEPPPPPPPCPPFCDERPSRRPFDPLADVANEGDSRLSPLATEIAFLNTEWVWGNASRVWGTLAPFVSLAPHNPGSLPVGADVVFAHATPAYFSLGAARGVTVAYNSATVRPTPVIFFDVSNPPGASPTAYSVQVRRASDGTLLTLLNGTQTVYYTPATTTALRLAAAFDAQSNALGTGWHDVTVTVTSHLPSGNQSNTVPTRLLVVDQAGSAFGRAVDLGGVQRVYTKVGTWSVIVSSGDGSAVFFDSFGQCQLCSFTSPAGEPSYLSKFNDATLGVMFRRQDPGGARTEFTSDGRISRAIGRFSDTTKFTWTDTLLTQIRDPMGKTLTLAYSGGKLLTVTDPGGRVTTYAMDGSGRLYRITDPDNVATNLGYDASHFLTSVTDRGGAVTNFTYDAMRRVDSTLAPTIQIHTGANARPRTKVTGPERIVWQPATPGTSTANKKVAVRPDTLFSVTIGPTGATVKTMVDRFRNATKVVGPFGETTTITRDTLGRALVTAEPNGHLTRVSYWSYPYYYSVGQRKDSTTGRVISFSYGTDATMTRVSGDVPQIDMAYHTGTNGPAGALDTVFAANRTVLVSIHRPDALGRDTLVKDGAQHATRTKYDSTWGNVREQKDQQGNITRFHYDALGRVDSSWVPASGVYTYQYDALNRRTQVKDPLGQITQYVYGPVTPNRVIDPKGQVYKFAYNALGLTIARHDLADTTKADTLKYDEGGNVRTLRTRRGDVITMTYDLAGRLRSRSGPDFPVDSFKYDSAGRWNVAWNGNARDSIVFDQAGRTIVTRQSLSGTIYQLSYTYDIRDRLYSRSAPTGGNVATYRYNATTGALDTLCAASACVAFRHNAEMLTDRQTYNPGLGGSWYRETAFNADHSMSKDSFSVAALAERFNTTWDYDSLGRIIGRDFPGYGLLPPSEANYSYDAIGRLRNRCAVSYGFCDNEYGGLGMAYSYDAAGNRTDSVASAVIGAGNRTQSFKGYTLGYDANGALTSKSGNGIAHTYTWDALGRLKEVRNSGALVAALAYDALGRRVSKTLAGGSVERHVYDGDHVILDLTGAYAVKAEYAYLPGTDRLFAIKNAQGVAWTGVAITDPKVGTIMGIANVSGGGLRKQYFVSPWGDATADTGVVTRFRMAGREYDQESKLYYVRARYYDPALGRFLSEDPIGIAGGLNLYVYAGNDPINHRDPSGLDCESDGDENEIRAANLSSGDEEPKCKDGKNDDGGDEGPFETWDQVWAWINWAWSLSYDFVSWSQGQAFKSNFFTRYAHLSAVSSTIYQWRYVRRGETIGHVGATGAVTGPHLHFEVWDGGKSVNPFEFLAANDLQDPLDNMASIRDVWGWRTQHPISGKISFHHGVDIAATTGTAVHSVAAGVVVLAGDLKNGYGIQVVIWH